MHRVKTLSNLRLPLKKFNTTGSRFDELSIKNSILGIETAIYDESITISRSGAKGSTTVHL